MCTPGNFGNEWKTQEKVLLVLILEFPPNLENHDQVVYCLLSLVTGSPSLVHSVHSILGNQCEPDVNSSQPLIIFQ